MRGMTRVAPKYKFTKEEMIAAAVQVVREKGIHALTAKALAGELGTSTQPVFTCFGTMEAAKEEVFSEAVRQHERYIQKGLKEPVPFFGVGMQYILFAREEPELYRLLFLTKAADGQSRAIKALHRLQENVRPSVEQIYRMSAEDADIYCRNLWLVVHGLAVLIVTGSCPYTEQEMSQILTGVSLATCKAIKEIPGFAAGTFDRDAVFHTLLAKTKEP